nr:MAG TPA: hypothetical protein [Caudoviricetes sp.]
MYRHKLSISRCKLQFYLPYTQYLKSLFHIFLYSASFFSFPYRN